MRSFGALLALAAASAAAATFSSPIEHVVVIMFENRAFDHYLGFMAVNDSRITGYSPGKTFSNPVNPADPAEGNIVVAGNASYVCPDPCHSVPCTTHQIFGTKTAGSVAHMDGFAASALEHHIPASTPLDAFTPEKVPVLSTLAKEFALFDQFFASIPGPTYPNRLMFHSATTNGTCDDCDDIMQCIEGFPQLPLYAHLSAANISWANYFEEVPDTVLFQWMREPEQWKHLHWFSTFQEHLDTGALPAFSFINPRFFGLGEDAPASDQHPSHDVATGEELMKTVYESLRGSAYWNNTLLLITYDEHGGFADFMPTPLEGVPSPDGLACPAKDGGFAFNRAGVRIPTVAISPWIAKNTVVGAPPAAAKPTPSSLYELTSIYATVAKMWGLPAMTHRDAWAATFEHLLQPNMTAPRTDCPTTLPNPPTEEAYAARRAGAAPMHGDAPLTDLQLALIRLAASLQLPGESAEDQARVAETASALPNERMGGLFVRDRVNAFLGRDATADPSHPHHKPAQ